ncbi:MAG TPA: arginyltransferase [Planctomycetota bacterium]|nr:arginyltransferase [Planctomycetota bacterium]
MRTHAGFATDTVTCPYLHDRPSRLEVRIAAQLSPAEHGEELAAGVRHFGRYYFRPICPGCKECISLRVLVRHFRPSKSQRRTLRRNEDVQLEIGVPSVDEERLQLYRKFHAEREAIRGWSSSHMDLEEYVATFVDNPVLTHEFRYRINGRLVAVAYVDESPGALSSITAFHDPDHSRRGLGTFDVLREIQTAHSLGKEHLYLGYHIAGCPSMEYKRTFRPHELLVDGTWMNPDEEGRRSQGPPSSPQ